MDALLQDLKYAARTLAKSPGFTLVAVLTLALGIGANTAIFGILHSVLLEPLPYPHPDRLVAAWETQGRGVMGLSALDLQDWQRQTTTLAHLAGYGTWEQNVAGGNEPARVSAAQVTPEFFEVFGVAPLVGRVFDTRDRALGAVISEGLWKRLFSGDPGVLGRSLRADGVTVPVIGVLPAHFDFPHGTEVWIPTDLATDHTSRSAHNYALVGSLTPAASLAAAQVELQGIAARIADEYPKTNQGVGARVMGLQESLVGSVRPTLVLLAVMVGIVLLIATANVAGLLMARATERRRELVMRAALGAGTWRLVRQLLAEGMVLAGVGASAGVLVAQWTVAALRLNPALAALPSTPGVLQIPVLAFTTVLACATAVLFSAVPAFAVTRIDLAETLKQTGGRGATAMRLRGALIGAEVALAVLLLLGAGLTARSLWRLEGERLGFDPDDLIVADVTFPATDSGPAWLAAYDRLLAAARSTPGIAAAAIGRGVPFTASGPDGEFLIEGRTAGGDAHGAHAEWRAASDGMTGALNIPLRSGRDFLPSDRDGPGVALVSETLARTYWPGSSPLGARIAVPGYDDGTYEAYRRGHNEWFTIVGVVGDVRDIGLGVAPRPTLYLALAQHPDHRAFHLVVRSGLGRTAVQRALAPSLAAFNPEAPVRLRTMHELTGTTVETPRLRSVLIGVFAALALLLATVGIYGLSAYVTVQRVPEIGVRVALGASPLRAASAVVRRVAFWAATGLAVGLVIGLAGAHAVARFLYGVAPIDPISFVVAALALATVALVATYGPARRAARLDPARALRTE
ncbi:MAG TPA: ABC transporter permease [Gemmatimonadales bacterium]